MGLQPRSSWSAWEAIPAVVTLGIVLAVTQHAFDIGNTLDFGLAYRGGEVAWESGRPEDLDTWMSTPFLGMIMALVSRVVPEATGAAIWTWANLLLYYGTIGWIWRQMRASSGRCFWWATLLAAAAFAPAISTIWWKQFNLAALLLAALGFQRLRQGKDISGGAAVAASLLVKPIVVLLPVALLVGRHTRRAGVYALVWAGALLGVAQTFLVWRARSMSVALPLDAIEKFAEKARPEAFLVCHTENFSPQSMLCRLAGTRHWTLQRGVILIGVLLLAALVLDRLKTLGPSPWELFAFVCLLSPMVSPIAWSHYQLLGAPLLLVTVLRLRKSPFQLAPWLLLIGSYLLFELVWQPSGTLPGAFASVIHGTPEDLQSKFSVFAIAMFGQYVLYLVGLLSLHPLDTGSASPLREPSSGFPVPSGLP